MAKLLEPHEADTESELSELSESELLRRFAQIDGADTESQLSDLSDLSDNEHLWRFERIDAAVIEDELAGMELLRIDNEVVQDTSSAAPAAAIQQEPKDTSHDGLAIPAFQEHPRHLANGPDPHDEFLPTAENLDNLHYPLEHQEPKDTSRDSVCGAAVSRQSNTYCLVTRRWWSAP
ncbi:hypothetical protein LTR96_001359 [Exophiala xenobiotica]|nr:hypothetical protein LTR96_001359 [Exophiala xenobiotica]KAK5547068.1 hypothetical protein LTR23_003071 [Chaetothyriales sp. CCFEE 6169]KAK5400061.1 hypothetical protein LTR79_002160 [Exophiala xenobiotica]KAK5413980.1 hypothetical protein LTR90_006618 [Exophiala xenobiotica]KAK5496365.1 hypothetical protein LTR83_004809 [Exophiala xenobiotica]